MNDSHRSSNKGRQLLGSMVRSSWSFCKKFFGWFSRRKASGKIHRAHILQWAKYTAQPGMEGVAKFAYHTQKNEIGFGINHDVAVQGMVEKGIDPYAVFVRGSAVYMHGKGWKIINLSGAGVDDDINLYDRMEGRIRGILSDYLD